MLFIWLDKGLVAFMLSLYISGVFHNFSNEDLIHNMRLKGIPTLISNFIEPFLQDRGTSIILGNFKGD